MASTCCNPLLYCWLNQNFRCWLQPPHNPFTVTHRPHRSQEVSSGCVAMTVRCGRLCSPCHRWAQEVATKTVLLTLHNLHQPEQVDTDNTNFVLDIF